MKKGTHIFVFTDQLTGEEYRTRCFPHEIHNIHIWDAEFSKWAVGRIIKHKSV
jgi:hypothetical protein